MLVTTKILPPTNTRGLRIRAYSPHHGASVTVGWDYGLGHLDQHGAAVAKLAGMLNAKPDAVFRGPYVVVRLVGDSGPTVGYAFDVQTESNVGRQAEWDIDGRATR